VGGVGLRGRSLVWCGGRSGRGSGTAPRATRPGVDTEPVLGGRCHHRRGILTTQVATGTVINGKIVLEGVALSDGARVTVVTRGADEGLTLTSAQENALLESIAQVERGEFVSLGELLASLPTRS
jgi:hypothetical protein